MKNRTLASRNVLGGFCGGFLGILAFSIFHLLLPIGCLLGVVIGFWYQEIWKEIKDESRKAYTSWCGFYNEAIIAPKDRFKEYLKQLKAKWSSEGDGISDFFFWIARVVIGTLRLSWKLACLMVRATRWPFKHPMNGVYLATTAALICFIGLLVRFAFPLCYSWMLSASGTNDGSWVIFMLFAFVFPLCLPVTASIVIAFNLQDMRSFYEDWQRYNRYGLLFHIGYKFLQISKAFALMVLWECLGLTYVVLGLVAVLGFMALPISIAKATLRVLWHFANMANHWLCFIITLTVTISSALLMQRYLHGIGLWVVAMGTGCVAGLASEAARRIMQTVLSMKPAVMTFANRKCGDDPIDELLVPLWKKNYSWLHKYIVGWIPVPIEQ